MIAAALTVFLVLAVAVWIVTWIIQGGVWGLLILWRVAIFVLRLAKTLVFALIWLAWWIVAPEAAQRGLKRAKENENG